MARVDVQPDVLEWAVRRSRVPVASIEAKFPKLAEWKSGDAAPTLRQLESFANSTYTPIGFLFLGSPPTESIPIPDFRTFRDESIAEPSANLLEMMYVCERRQEWYRDFARSEGADPLQLVGSVDIGAEVVRTAEALRTGIGFGLPARASAATWTDALRQFIVQLENSGVLVMVSGVVLNNTHRKLDVEEFRGFAIADSLAPLIFVNGADSKSGQMFTLAHELAHIAAGQSALSNPQPSEIDGTEIERWCNAVAAEFLVPIASVREAFQPDANLVVETQRLARLFKVSTLVVLRRIRDLGRLSNAQFWRAYEVELDRLRTIDAGGSSGGNFHFTEAVRVSRRFAQALVSSTLAGRTLYRDAFQMLGLSKLETFHEFGRSLGVIN